MRKTEYRLVKVTDIKVYKNNPRTMQDEDRAVLARSIREFGNVGVLIVDKDMNLISGHQRLSVLIEFGIKEVMVVVGDYNEAEASELLVFMNTQLGTGRWDKNKLDELFISLKDSDSFDKGIFEELQLDKLEQLELSQHRDLKEFQGEYMPEKTDGGTSQMPQSHGNPVYSHNIVFRDEAELNTFLSWLHNLREKYPDTETTSERILLELVGDERGER